MIKKNKTWIFIALVFIAQVCQSQRIHIDPLSGAKGDFNLWDCKLDSMENGTIELTKIESDSRTFVKILSLSTDLIANQSHLVCDVVYGTCPVAIGSLRNCLIYELSPEGRKKDQYKVAFIGKTDSYGGFDLMVSKKRNSYLIEDIAINGWRSFYLFEFKLNQKPSSPAKLLPTEPVDTTNYLTCVSKRYYDPWISCLELKLFPHLAFCINDKKVSYPDTGKDPIIYSWSLKLSIIRDGMIIKSAYFSKKDSKGVHLASEAMREMISNCASNDYIIVDSAKVLLDGKLYPLMGVKMVMRDCKAFRQ